MITRIEALNFRCLRHVDQTLDRFHILVGPNASGKTTFLDVVSFLGQVLSDGLEKAVRERTDDFNDLLWKHEGNRFELAVEAMIPDDRRQLLANPEFDAIRYEIAFTSDAETNEIGIHSERVLLKTRAETEAEQSPSFPGPSMVPDTIFQSSKIKNTKAVITKVHKGNDNFYSEVAPRTQNGRGGKTWVPAFKLGSKKSALANLPEDETNFPASVWLKETLARSVQKFVLNSLAIRRTSPPGQGFHFLPDGSNLPWVVSALEEKHPERKRRWISHLQTALSDLTDIHVGFHPDTRHRFLILEYRGGLKVPSWMASDGTLRMLALTLPAYIPEFDGIYLIEEPENGIHPMAVETVYQALSSVTSGQILVATHSPVIVNVAEPDTLLCFAKTDEGAASLVRGNRHPALEQWEHEVPLGSLFAGGILS